MFLNSLIFHPKHIPAILSGKKTATVKLWLGPIVDAGATVMFVDSHQGTPFALGQIVSVQRKEICSLTDEDMRDSQHSETLEELAKKLSEYYEKKVTVDSDVVVIRFKVVSDGQDEEEYEELLKEEKKRRKGIW